jgi:hypothetical protein
MVFQRVPYEKRLHWLWLWNVDNNPSNVDCTLAMDIVSYFASMKTQTQARYYHGKFGGIAEAKADFDLCLRVRGLSVKDPERAKVSLITAYIEPTLVECLTCTPVCLYFPLLEAS